MAANKIKLKVHIDLEFEGQMEQGKAVQQGIMSDLSNLQNRLTGGATTNPTKQIESNLVDPPRTRRRRRRSSAVISGDGASAAANGESNGNGDGTGEGDGDDGSAPRRNLGVSPTQLLVDLRKGGFFAEKQTAGAVKDELHRKGFSMVKPTDLSSPLASLARADVLRRDKDSTLKQWVYTNGTKDEPDRG